MLIRGILAYGALILAVITGALCADLLSEYYRDPPRTYCVQLSSDVTYCSSDVAVVLEALSPPTSSYEGDGMGEYPIVPQKGLHRF